MSEQLHKYIRWFLDHVIEEGKWIRTNWGRIVIYGTLTTGMVGTATYQTAQPPAQEVALTDLLNQCLDAHHDMNPHKHQ